MLGRDGILVASSGVHVKEGMTVKLIKEENSLELPDINRHQQSPPKRRSPTQVSGSHKITRKQFKEQKEQSKKLEEKKRRKTERMMKMAKEI